MSLDDSNRLTATRTVAMTSTVILSELIDAVADIARDKWWEFGLALGCSHAQLSEYREINRGKLQRTIYQIIHDWHRKMGDDATVGILLRACKKVNVSGEVTARLRREECIEFV